MTGTELQYISDKYHSYSEEEGSYPPSININTVDKFKFFYKYTSSSIGYFFIKDGILIQRTSYLHDYNLMDYVVRDLGKSDTKLMFEYIIKKVPSLLEFHYKKELKKLNDRYLDLENHCVKTLSEKLGKMP